MNCWLEEYYLALVMVAVGRFPDEEVVEVFDHHFVDEAVALVAELD